MENKYALVTGASRGLGLELTRLLLEKEYSVAALIRKDNASTNELKKKYMEKLLTFTCDVTDEDGLRACAGKIAKVFPYLDILLNNAAINLDQPPKRLEELDFSIFETTYAVNSVAPLKVAKHFLPLLKKGNEKTLVSISSEAGSIGNAQRESEFAYCMSKAALNMGMKILHNYLKDEGIRILALHPGWIRSDMGGPHAEWTPAESAQKMLSYIQSPPDDPELIYLFSDGKPFAW